MGDARAGAGVRAYSRILVAAVKSKPPIKWSCANRRVDSRMESGAHGEPSGWRQECKVIGTEVTFKLSGLDEAGGQSPGQPRHLRHCQWLRI